jgi:hypothetical protein
MKTSLDPDANGLHAKTRPAVPRQRACFRRAFASSRDTEALSSRRAMG